MRENRSGSDLPIVSAIITLYNKELWIARAIESVLKQTESDFELIIVNDGSTDGSMEVVGRYRDPRIRVVSKKNSGLPAARNTGIGVSRGRYIAFLDADDEWLPWHLASALEGFRRHPGSAVIANRYHEVFNHDETSGGTYGIAAPAEVETARVDSLLENLSRGRFLFHVISAVISKEAMEKTATFFEEKMDIGEDLNFFIRMSLVGEIYVTRTISTIYHRCDSNSMMNLTGVQPKVTPRFFRGVAVPSLSSDNLRRCRRFLMREYLKRAYQNRGLDFSSAEVTLPLAEIPPALSWKLYYLLLRFSPSPLMTAVVRCKKRFVA